MPVCGVEGCTRWADRAGLCFPHYLRLRRTGTTDIAQKPTEAERFWAKVEVTDECWTWTGAVSHFGHGNFRDTNHKFWKSHRYAWAQLVGCIPEGLVLDHLCRNPACVCPEHLDLVTPSVNVNRGRAVKPWLLPTPKPQPKPKLTPEQRFWELVEIGREDGCWWWLGSHDPAGYGQFKVARKGHKAHRWAYEHIVGPIPKGMVLDHLCHTPACVRPEHLELVTPGENTRRGRGVTVQLDKTHCPRGHEFTDENTYVYQGKYGPQRHCRACKREKAAEKRAPLPKKGYKNSNGNALKTHCKYGHPLDGPNLMVTPTRTGTQRRCRICHNATTARNIAKRKIRQHSS